MSRRFPLAIAVLLAVSACGGSSAPPSASGPSTPASVAPTGVGSTPDPSTTPSAGGSGSVAQPSSTGSPRTSSAGKRSAKAPFVLEVELNTECATPGTTMIARVRTWPDVQVAFAAAYNDEDYFPDWHWVPRATNTDGNVVWTWEITPAHPTGPAELTVVAGNADGGGTERRDFEVATTC